MHRALILVTALFLAACATSGPPDLTRDVDRILGSQHDKTIAVAYYDLRDGTTLLRNERETFHAASTMKVPVMFGIFESISRGELRLDQPVRVRNQFTSIYDGSSYALSAKDDSDDEVYKVVGQEMPLEYLVRHMIVRSSNLATNNVIDLISAKQVMTLMHRIGANDIKVLRGVEDQKAFDHGMNNTTTAYDLMLIFRALGEKTVISPEASQKMIDILSAQEFNRGIPAGLPRGTRVAHKTGDITRVAHDAALVLPDDGSSYVLVILTRGYRKTHDAEKIMARLSHAVWRARVHRSAGAATGSIDSPHRAGSPRTSAAPSGSAAGNQPPG
jgi:beta-lactamase class A